jgi:CP family cyanate transporter-like MFS transporter
VGGTPSAIANRGRAAGAIDGPVSLQAGAGMLVALFACALALRPQLVGVGPLLGNVQDDLGVSHAVAGLLGTFPVLCMGLFAPAAPFLSARVGTRSAIAVSLAGIAVFGVARAVVPGAAGVILLTIAVGVGMGLAGAILPVAVKERFAARPGFATGVYATGINLGSAVSAALAVPLANALWGWRAALLVFSLFTAGLVGLWLWQTRHERGVVRRRIRPPRLPIRSGVAWVLVAVFALMAVVFYGLNAWLPDAYVEEGWSEGRAGALAAVLNGVAVPTALVVPWLSDRVGSRRMMLATSSAVLACAIVGAILAPGAGFLWAVLMGMGVGGQFPLVMMLPLDAARRPSEVGAVSGLMLGAGYTIAAVCPFALGAVRDATGSFAASLWLIVGAAVLLLAVGLPLSRERLHRAALAHASQ